jgi:hypothetical protein
MLARPAHVQHALAQLQALTKSVVDGDTAVTDIPVTGITLGSQLLSVMMFAAGVPSDVTADASITSAGNIQLATVNSTGNKLVVEWVPAPDSTLL